MLSVSVCSLNGPEMKGVCYAVEGTAEVSGLQCTKNKKHSCTLLNFKRAFVKGSPLLDGYAILQSED